MGGAQNSLNPIGLKMNLVIDIGNTRVKAAVFDNGRAVAVHACESFGADEAKRLLELYPSVEKTIVSSTAADAADVARQMRRLAGHCLLFGAGVPVPIRSSYATPETLGADRIAAAVGAAWLYPGRNVAIADFGTALTVDLVTADGTYRGGFISPGLKMRFRALHDYTSRLPECSATERLLPLGDSTQSCIEQGVMQGMAAEAEGLIARLRAENEDLLIIFTGGDAKFFVKRIKNAIFADCEPVLCGLDRILEYNVPE